MTLLSAAEAARQIVSTVRRQPTLRVFLDDALGAVLAADAVSPLDLPAHTNSAMDGYAARGADVTGAATEHPVRLTIVEELPAGRFPSRTIGPGECARIFTGSPLPPGADTVVRQEDTDQGRPVVTVLRDRDVGKNIRHAGEDVRAGSVVVSAGTELGAAEIGMLTAVGLAHPVVYRAPRVAILASGDEIVDVDQVEAIVSGLKTASSNTHTLIAMVREAGAEPVNLGIAADTPQSLREHFQRADGCDLLVTTAGISVGEHDHVRGVLEELGADLKFWRLRMRPGAPVGFGLVEGMPWIGLPGNPVSTMVTFELFVRPAIRRMRGLDRLFRRSVPVTVTEPITLRPRLQHFLRGIVTPGADGLEARLTGPQGSGILSSMVQANALLIIPEGQRDTPAGSRVRALLRSEPWHVETPPFD